MAFIYLLSLPSVMDERNRLIRYVMVNANTMTAREMADGYGCEKYEVWNVCKKHNITPRHGRNRGRVVGAKDRKKRTRRTKRQIREGEKLETVPKPLEPLAQLAQLAQTEQTTGGDENSSEFIEDYLKKMREILDDPITTENVGRYSRGDIRWLTDAPRTSDGS